MIHGSEAAPSRGLVRLADLLKFGALSVAVAYIGLYLWIAFLRVTYPFDLEWMEAGSVEHVRRLLTGQPIYVSPSLEFVPYPYPPLYYYLSAALAAPLGLTFTPLRLISLFSSLGSFLAIYLLVKRETSNPYAAGLAAGLFAATFRISGAWFDIARVDSLFLMLLLAGLNLVRAHTSHVGGICAGLLFSLAILTKQTALIPVAAVIVYLVITDVRRAVTLGAVIGLVAGGGTLALDRMSDGWYSYYVFELPAQFRSRVVRTQIAFFWTRDLLSRLTVACALAAAGLAGVLAASKRRGLFYLVVTPAMLVAAWLPRLQSGGYDNTLMPAYAAICILFGIGVHEVISYARRWSMTDQVVASLCVSSLCLLQYGALFYDPSAQVPTRRDLRAGRGLVEKLARIEGRIFMPSHSGCYLPELMPRCGSAHQMAIADVLDFGSDEARTTLSDDYARALAERRFDAILLDSGSPELLAEIEKHYVRQDLDLGSAGALWPVTGHRTRPALLFVPRASRREP